MSFPRYPKYKPSGVEWLGEVPEHWGVMAIKRIVSQPITDGPHETPEFLDEGVPFVSAEAVSSGRIDFSKIRGHISAQDNERYSQKYSPKLHDIYMVKSGATTGVTAIVEGRTDFNIWSPLAVIRCGEKSAPYFVLNFMRSRNFSEGVTLNWSFGTQQNIGMGVIGNLACTIPPLPEQTAIAEFLDRETGKIDGLVAEQRRLMELLKEKRQAVISHAVTKGLNPHAPMKPSGIEWLGDVPAGWEVIQLRRQVAEHRQGYYSTDPYVDSGVKLLRITDLGESGEVSYDSCPRVEDRRDVEEFILRVGDFVFARTGGAGSFGLIGEISERIAYASYLIRFRFCSGALPRFLRFFFLSAGFKGGIQRDIHGGVNQNVHAQDIKNQCFALPPTDEQTAIAEFLETELLKFDTLTAEAQRAIDLLQERRTALISAAVTGQIDVRPHPKN